MNELMEEFQTQIDILNICIGALRDYGHECAATRILDNVYVDLSNLFEGLEIKMMNEE